MPRYRVKSPIMMGTGENNPDGTPKLRTVEAGGTVELTEQEAYEARHALANPPQQPKLRSLAAAEEEGQEDAGDVELDENEQAALESIRRNPTNPDSGVMLHWKTDRVAVEAVRSGRAALSGTLETRPGFERANAGNLQSPLAGGFMGTNLGERPEENKTEMELEEEEKIRAAEDKLRQDSRKPTGSSAGTTPQRPVQQPAQQPKPGTQGTAAATNESAKDTGSKQ